MANTDNKLVLNPEFKSQLVALKAAVKKAFDIQLSIDKLVMDEQYRASVLDELLSLDNAEINESITQLQNTPVYLETAPVVNQAANANAQLQVEKQKKSPVLLFSALAVICVLLVAVILLQSNIIQLNVGANAPVAQVPVQQPVVVVQQPAPQVVQAPVATPTPAPAVVEKLTLPVENPEMVLRLHGSNTVGEHLAPALLEAFLADKGITETKWIQGDAEVERQLQYIKGDKAYAIELHAHGSSTAFKDLLAGSADMGMASRQIKDKEVEALKPQYGNLGLAGNELIIGLDGLATIVNPQNPISKLTTEQIAQVFSGEIKNWKDLGGEDLAINIYARDGNSGTWDTFKNLVLKVHQKKLSADAQRFESSSELSDLVAADKGGIGFIGLPYINNSKALSIAASQWSNPIYPTRFTVSTEDYPLARRLYMYAPSSSSAFVKEFANFTTSTAGQDVVEKIGLVSQNIKREKTYKIKGAPKAYNDYTEVASRLSVNFRFKSGSNQLDNKGQKDVLRLVEYMTKHQGRRIVLMGFSDALGEAKKNIKLSYMRANVLEKELMSYGLNVTAVEGFGSQLPIASNKTAMGRSKNRRVEVWVY